MNHRVLRDDSMQHALETDGFVRMPLLDLEQCQKLRSIYLQTEAEHLKGVSLKHHTTTQTNNSSLVKSTNEAIRSVLLPRLNEYLVNVCPMHAVFMIKEPGKDTEIAPHQDWTFVDENQYWSLNCWVALQDVDKDNGCMYFIPGTHRICPSMRVAPNCPGAYEHVRDLLMDYAVDMPMKAGECLIFTHAVMHGSHGNTSGKPRIAATQGLRSSNSTLLYYFMENYHSHQKIEKYEMTLEDYLTMPHDGRPLKAKSIEYHGYDFPQINPEEFRIAMDSYARNRSIPNRFRAMLSRLTGWSS